MAAANSTRAFLGLAVALVVLLAAVLGVFAWLRARGAAEPVVGQQRCVATANNSAVALDLNQAHFTSIIVGLSVRRKLPPRAASIAMATAYQETGIRNLDYGDRDSVGLFQQRPSQGWGSEQELMDPYYATNKFYDALVKLKGWQSGDINDVAQQVQRSGFPEAYRDHERDARILASTLTGRSPGGFTCLERSGSKGDAAALVSELKKTLGSTGAKRAEKVVTINAKSKSLAWAYASYAVANAKRYGLVTAEVGSRRWQTQAVNVPAWGDGDPAADARLVRLTVR